jgi:hypothetical protein
MTRQLHAGKGKVHETLYWQYREKREKYNVNTDDYLTNTL